jgi:hypothetical protein
MGALPDPGGRHREDRGKPVQRSSGTGRRRSYQAEIFLVSASALLLEISTTRLISFKLFYYYTYLIIGFAMLGMGSGGVLVALSERLRRAPLDRVCATSCLVAALCIGAGYFLVALLPFDTSLFWRSAGEPAKLLAVCFALFAPFAALGVMIAALFARRTESIHRLYFADLLGAGAGCAAAVPLLIVLSPPGCIFLAGLILALTGARLATRRWPAGLAVGVGSAALLAVGVAVPGILPDPVADRFVKTILPTSVLQFSRWSPVFRIDVTSTFDPDDAVREIHHDGIWGSSLHRFDGDVSSLKRFDADARSFPFRTLGREPREVAIIGSAGGHEILASLYFGAERITAVELNPVTMSLLTDSFADYTGHLHRNPRVALVNDEGRSFLARQERGKYDLIVFVAPDTYTAANAAIAGAFVLSESYLYTAEMIVESLEHLTPDGVVCMLLGELSYEVKPNRTTRYVSTAREALLRLGVADFRRHILVATTSQYLNLSTILLKREPFTPEEIERFLANAAAVPQSKVRHAWGRVAERGPVNAVISLKDAALDRWYRSYPYDVSPVSDNSPFFYHFARFRTVLEQLGGTLQTLDIEDSHGERVLLLMVAIAFVFASVFLLLPFLAIRSAAYFAALGLGFMFFEICLIQKLTLFLGFPTYSLTVTLMALLVFTGLGSLATPYYRRRPGRKLALLLLVVLASAAFYRFGMDTVTSQLMAAPLAVRILAAIAFIAPLGLTLGAFMPLGLSTLAQLTEHGREYVAWGWAVNGFASVLGSVLTTILSMTFGFGVVLVAGMLLYIGAVGLLWSLRAELRASRLVRR